MTAFCPAQAAAIIAVRPGPSPPTSISRPGWSSMTCMTPTPKCATIRPALTGPMPPISPDPRYFWIPAAVAGSTMATEDTSNCRPYLGWDDHRPRSRRNSPTRAPSSGPTAVTSSPPLRPGATRAIVYPVSGLANVTRSKTPPSTAPPPGDATVAGTRTIFHPNGP